MNDSDRERGMAEQRTSGFTDGIRTGIGILSAFKDAIEETLEEAIQRGDLSPDRARLAVRDAAERVQSSLTEARGRLELVSRSEFEALVREVEAIRQRLDRLDGGGSALPEPVMEPGVDGIPID